MPTVNDVLEHVKWLIEHGRGGEKAFLYMPKVEIQRQRENKEQRRRVVFVTDPLTYSEWHTQRDRWIEACGGHPTIAYHLMCKVLAAVSEETIATLVEEGHEEEQAASGPPKAQIPEGVLR